MAVSNNNRQVAKNTLILYVRMFVTMAIGMWTSRIVINALGFTDQGIYNVVAGFVGFSSLLTSSISSSINRFITFAIGKSDIGEVNKAVQNGITVQWILAGVIFVIAETIGLWFLLNKLVIPEGREFAAYVIYQLAIISLILNLLTSTDSALILANEQFNIFAYVAIVNSLIALGIGYTIANVGYDRLILYSSLQLVAVLGVRIFYTTYIHKKYPSIKRKFGWHKELFRPIFSFAGWNGIGSGASVLRTSGTSVLLNMFGGPIANTINGIANSVNVLASVFVNDFTSAYSPQIIKRYAAGEYQSLMSFLCQCSKFSFCLIAVIAIPLLFNVEPLLILWLKHIPVGTAIFARLIIIYTIIECISKPLICAKNATGSIRNYQLVVGGILLMTLPLTYVFLKIGLPLYFSYISIIITSVTAFVARMLMLKGDIPFWSTKKFISETLLRCFWSSCIVVILPAIMFFSMPDTVLSVLIQCIVGVIWSAFWLYKITLDQHERDVVKNMISKLISKIYVKKH